MRFDIALLPAAQADLAYWKATSPKTVSRIARLLQDISEHPFTGIGRPEALKWNLTGYWSRRINAKGRIVYRVDGQKVLVFVLSLRNHYL